MPDISIIILSYNTKRVTKKCLTTLLKILGVHKTVKSEIIVVDNGSDDGSVEMIKKFSIFNFQYSKNNIVVKTIFNKKNVGYPRGNNQGLKMTGGKYILFLNSDVLIGDVDFKEILDYLDQHKEVGVLTVKVILPDGNIDPASHRGFPTLWNSLCYFLGLERALGRLGSLGKLFGGYHLTHLDLGTVHEIDSPSGAFYLTRRDVLDKVGGFDEKFFMYGEDLDLSYRIKQLGSKVLYYPLFKVTHLKHASGLKTTDRKTRKETKMHFYDAMKVFYKKHYEKRNGWFINKLVYFFIELKQKFL